MTTREIEMITTDFLTGKPPRVKGKEADAFRKEFAKDVAKAKANGWVIDVPSEIAVDAGE